MLSSLRDLTGISNVRAFRGLEDIPDDWPHKNWPGWRSSRVLPVALWTAMTQRGLPTLDPPKPLERSDVIRLETVIPTLVDATRRLAAEHGVTDPLPADG